MGSNLVVKLNRNMSEFCLLQKQFESKKKVVKIPYYKEKNKHYRKERDKLL